MLNTIKVATPLILFIDYHVVAFMLEDQKTTQKQCAAMIFMLLKWNCLHKVHQGLWGSLVFKKRNQMKSSLIC